MGRQASWTPGAQASNLNVVRRPSRFRGQLAVRLLGVDRTEHQVCTISLRKSSGGAEGAQTPVGIIPRIFGLQPFKQLAACSPGFEATKRVVIQPTYPASSRRAPRV
jgi:hypothetical protein